MSGLFDSLSSASSALNAQRMGLDVTGQNMANINTVGYTRRSLLLAEVPSADPREPGRGVEVVAIRAARDQFMEARIRREQSSASYDSAVIDSLSTIEGAVGPAGASLDARITAFFDAFANLADDVTSPSARDSVVEQGRQLALAFSDMSTRFTETRRDVSLSIRGTADEINRLATEVAHLNAQIMINGPEVEALRDERDVALAQLAQLGGVSTMARQDGGVDVTIGQGRALVVGAQSYALDVAPTGPSGDNVISINGTDITAEIRGGQLGGQLQMRDVTIPAHQARLDQLAYDVSTQINAVHVTGFDGNGAPAGNFFTAPAGVTDAARLMAVDPNVLADSSLVAGSATGAVGDNGTARGLAALRDARVLSGGTRTAAEAWSELVYHVGSDVAGARASSQSHDQIVRQLQQLRDQASGVSLDEEAAHLMKYQRAYEASARYFTTIVDAIDAVLEMVR